ncbi:MAG TPA: leucine-rich repeat domain-containing protein [Candidatus Hydrogenedentes bacterium]|nr:leucine-rich repeat domain-containing protein [Candidatus Hydrogenedentota bacterium]HRT20739.1 leucine-rich repeat domain-containing protein [Candidatus Hydrogenedentota bacterium]HRT66012.1 leucine-rich repeat domain-containing protein [Candidatus Hydrogenedentota bacterium]
MRDKYRFTKELAVMACGMAVLLSSVAGAQAPPPNDLCGNAEVILAGTPVFGTTVGATGTDISSCGYEDALDVWYSFTPATNMEVLIDTWESDVFDSTLAVYDGCGGTELACNDDSNCDNKSAIRISVTSGNTYLIRVAENNGSTGYFSLVAIDLSLDAGGGIVFGDPMVKAAVRHAIDKYTGPIYPADVQGVGFSYIRLCGMGVTTLKGLEECTDLTDVIVTDNQIASIAPLASLPNLFLLHISNNHVSDLSPLSDLMYLYDLDVSYNPLSSLAPLAAVYSLQSLYIDSCGLNDLSDLANLYNLQLLVARNNNIADLTPLSALTSLENLDVSSNPLGALAPLATMYNLRYLYLGSCGLTGLDDLDSLYNLNTLDAANNRITSVSPLSSLMYLVHLNLSNNRISDTSPFSAMNGLESIVLSDNPITDLSGIVMITGFGSGNYLDVRRTPLGSNALCEQIPTLTARGADVDYTGACSGEDADDDGLQDELENEIGTNPNKTDTDNDGISDYDEFVYYGTNPTRWDTDGDWASDWHEITSERNPLDPASTPVLTEVIFPDSNLEAAIRSAINKPEGPIWRDPVEHINALYASYSDIQDLTGSEFLINAETLFFNGNPITFFSPLSGLTNLKNLYLADTGIADLTPLTGLTNLEYLYLSINPFTSIEPLRGLTSLQALYVDRSSLASIYAVSDMPNLQTLDVHQSAVTDISAVSGMTALRYLDVGGNQIADVGPIAGLVNLEFLGIWWLQLTSLDVAAGLVNLQRLDAEGNQIADIAPLSAMTNLNTLYLQQNRISNLSPLSGLTTLTHLYLGENRIAGIGALSGLTALNELTLNNNRIGDVAALTGLTNLYHLDLAWNPITDIGPLVANAGIGSEDTVNLEVTPLNQTSLCSHVPALQGRGVGVSYTGTCGGQDSDDDGLLDAYESEVGTSLTKADSDNDGLNDYDELVTHGTDPRSWDTDGDWASDLHEVAGDSNPLDPLSMPSMTEVIFPDANLEAAIREATGILVGVPIYEDPLLRLTELYASYRGITDLTGLEYCVNLTQLSLNGNAIADTSPLSGLTNLQILELDGNQIASVAPLAPLTALTLLDLGSNQITDASGLSGLTALHALHLGYNLIASAANLPVLPNLATLTIPGNSFESLDGIEAFANLSILVASENLLTDIGALASLTNLQYLYLDANLLVDITPLLANEGIGDGDTVWLSGNPLNLASLNAIETLRSRGVYVDYNDPVIWAVNPDRGPVGGGFMVTITGERFDEFGTTQVKVMRSSTEELEYATDVVVQSGGYTGATTITCTFPAFTPGVCDVVVVNPSGAHAYLYDGFTYEYEAEPPVILQHPVSQTVNPGDTAAFTVEAAGTEPFTYQWWFDNTAKDPVMVGSDSPTFSIEGVAEADEGRYWCEVSNASGSVSSNAAVLSVNNPVAFTAHPQSLTVNPGANATFSATVTGTPPISFQWRKNGSPIVNATNATYSITNAQQSDEGSFTCVATNIVGSATSNAAALTVTDPPVFTTQPQPATVNPGASVTFTVAATGTAPLSYRWQKGTVDIAGATLASYTISSAQQSDEGAYRCVVSNVANPGGAISNAATLVVNDPPAITTHPQSLTVATGESASFTVAATGTAPLSYQWAKGGVSVGGATAATLSIASVQPSDAGSYTCTVGNMAGSVESNTATLTVNALPVITQQPASATVNLGQPVSFSVVAEGAGPLSYQWTRNGTPIASGTSATLNIAAAQSSDAGSYVCTVSNPYGGVPSDPATLQVNARQLTMARVGTGTMIPAQGVHSYAPDEVVTIRALPVAGWAFDRWEGAVANPTANPTTVVMDADKTVTAVFVRTQYTLTVAVTGNGKTTPAAGQYTHSVNATIDLAATAFSGWMFDRWEGPVLNTAAPSTQVVMDADKSVRAVFVPSALLTLSKIGSGSVQPFEGTQAVKQGTTVSIQANPANGWQFKRWDGLVVNTLSAMTTIQVMYDSQATAVFVPSAQTLQVTGVATDARNGSPIGGATVTLFNFETGASLDQTQTDESGQFAVSTPSADLFLSLHVSKANYDNYDLPRFQAPAGLNVALIPSAPDAPQGLTAIPGATQILLRWEPNTEPDLKGYRVYRSDSPTGTPAPITPIAIPYLRHVDTTAAPGHSYFYMVTAVDTQDNESDYSEQVEGRPGQITIWMPDIDGDSGECIRIPLNVANTAGIDPHELRIELAYNANVLDPATIQVERTAITADAVVAQDTSTPGKLVITTSQGSVLKGEGHIFDVRACIKPGLALNTCGNLSFTDVFFRDENGNDVLADYFDTARVCVTGACKMGDMDGNGIVQMFDATVVLRIVVKKVIPDGCQLTAGDMNGDTLVDSADAVMIMRIAEDRPLNPEEDGQTVRGRQIHCYIPNMETGPGGSVDIPIYIDNPEGLSGCELFVTFPAQSSMLVLNSISRGTATQNYSMAYDIGNGLARIVFSNSEAAKAAKSTESLAILHFNVPDTAPKKIELPISLNEAKLKGEFGDDLSWYNSVEKSAGTLSVNSLLCGAAVVSVVNKATGAPIRTGSVQLSPGPPFALTQNTDGIYVFSCMNTGTAQVKATAPGFKEATGQVTIMGGSVATVELQLEAAGPINGGCCGGFLQDVTRIAPPHEGDPLMPAAVILALAASAVFRRKRIRT